ncbi:uncharacterized protein LOC110853031 [Folsomia candida]|uniref:Hemicentin-2 n=1 Tax=Folsomia candida TaxID=158441 RepID=A0A226F1D2_FOLCA|nr:uncharacterized protein LOC110853031 [Folsomia candida]OXA63288.1 Hemicentin-2 [Folsomia candida]
MAVSSIEHGQVYRFNCLADNKFLDLHMKTTDHGNKLIVWDGNTSNAQRFRAEIVDDGFRLLSQCRGKGEPLRVITEQADGKGLVIYADHNTDSNHVWHLETHEGGDQGTYVLIINNGSGKALANQGYKNQVRCINPDFNDVHQQWRIHVAEHDQPGHMD